MPVHVRRRRRLAAIAATAVAAAGLQTALASPAEAGQVGVTVSIQGAGSVTVVEGSLEDGAAYTCIKYDNKDHRVTVTCPRVRNSEAFEAWVWLRAQPSSFPEGQWVFDGWSGCDETRVKDGHTECAVHSGAFSSDERTPTARFRDTVAPVVTSGSVVQEVSADRLFRFAFTADDGQLECRLKSTGEAFKACSSPLSRVVAWGADQLQVRAVDSSGNVGAVRAIDVVGVDTFLIPMVSARTGDASFSYDGVPGAEYWCLLDNVVYSSCGTGASGNKTYVGLADGRHVFKVYAQLGSVRDHFPATYEWTVDSVAPTTVITPDVDGRGATFTFPSAGTVKQECRMTGPVAAHGWVTCSSPVTYHSLPDGDFTFEVRSMDAAGNIESPPASHSWTVDGAAPETTTRFGPTGFVLSGDASFGVVSSEEGSAFTCTVDGAPRPCGPVALNVEGLSSGTHTMTAAATDRNGNTDATPATRSWTVAMTAGELSRAKGWKRTRYAAAYGGSYLLATKKGATLTRSVTGARALALVVSKGSRHGKVKVYAGSRLLKTVRLSGRGTRQLVTVGSFNDPFTGSVRIVVASKDRPVRIEGLGVATR